LIACCSLVRPFATKIHTIILQFLDVRKSGSTAKVNSVQEACTKCFAVHISNLKSCKPHEKTIQKLQNGRSIYENDVLDAIFFSCNLQDFKFWYVNRKEFGTSFLYWVDFKWIRDRSVFPSIFPKQYLRQFVWLPIYMFGKSSETEPEIVFVMKIKTKPISGSHSQILQNAYINIVVHWKFWRKYRSVSYSFSCTDFGPFLHFLNKEIFW
jgi:hypothetical protein